MQLMRPLLATLTGKRVLSQRVQLIASILVLPLLLLGPVVKTERKHEERSPTGEGGQPVGPGRSEPTVLDLIEVDLEEALRPRVSPRTRAAQVGVVLAGMLVVVLVIVGLQRGGEPFQQRTAALLSSPTPTNPTFVIASNVNFGALTVNGYVLKDSPPVATRLLHEGTNVVTLSAPPFGQRTCRFWYTTYQLYSSYQLSSDTRCSLSNSDHSAFAVRGVSMTPDLILDIELNGEDLPPTLASSASRAAQQAVAAAQPQTMVPSGQYYATGQDAQGHISSRRATAPLHAQMLLALGGCGSSQFCPLPLDPRLAFAPGQHIWSVGLLLTARWRFTPSAGPAVYSPTAPLMLPLQIFLDEEGAGGWNVLTLLPSITTVLGLATLADQLTAALCQVGVDLLAELLQAQNLSGSDFTVASNQSVEGCAIQLLQGPSASTAQGRFFWRFGVLLAVDPGAHRLAPWLPVAPSAAVAAVES
jgi:hypothetical protein